MFPLPQNLLLQDHVHGCVELLGRDEAIPEQLMPVHLASQFEREIGALEPRSCPSEVGRGHVRELKPCLIGELFRSVPIRMTLALLSAEERRQPIRYWSGRPSSSSCGASLSQ